MFEWMQSLNPAKVEAERFAVYRPEPEPEYRHRPPVMTPTRKQRRQDARKSLTRGLDLPPAQERAVTKWLEGLEK